MNENVVLTVIIKKILDNYDESLYKINNFQIYFYDFEINVINVDIKDKKFNIKS